MSVTCHPKLIKIIAKGRYASIYKATDMETYKTIAVKRIEKDIFTTNREPYYARELAAMKKLTKHSNVVRYLNYYETFHHANFALEYIDGFTLHRIIYESKSGVEEKVVTRTMLKSYFIQLIQGIKHIHRNGVYHGDLKPENIIIYKDRVKIVDFGCSILSETGVCDVGERVFCGTYGYIPPEAYIGSKQSCKQIVLSKVDVWALGVTMYYCYTTFVPFVSNGQGETMSKVIRLEYDITIVPSDLNAIIRKIFVTQNSERATIEEVEGAIRSLKI